MGGGGGTIHGMKEFQDLRDIGTTACLFLTTLITGIILDTITIFCIKKWSNLDPKTYLGF